MFNHLPDHLKGLALAALGGLVLTIDIPILRLANGEPWSVMFVRSAIVLIAVAAFVLITRAAGRPAPKLVPGKIGWIVTLIYGVGSVAFLAAVYNTSTANLVFILAFNPMFAALLSWIFLGERPRGITLAAMIIMAGGVFVIVHEGLSAGNFVGDMLALVAGFSIAAAITITRASGKDMGFTALIASAVPLAAAAVMVAQTGLLIDQPLWLLINGAFVIPVSFFCLAAAPKYLSGAEVAMFYLLETVLAPVWVWMIFAEVPSRQSAIGGGILIITLFVHSLWQLRAGRRRRAVSAVRHTG